MHDIYNILARYFSNEASSEEQKAVEDFRKENELEFSMLKRLWEKDKIEVVDFDTQRALANVKQKTRKGRKVSLFRTMSRIAAVFVLVASISVYLINKNTELFHPEMITQVNPGPENMKVTLPDGTAVWLNESASITYPEEFRRKKRAVEMTGEAFFKVMRNVEKPFQIEAGNAFVEVLGTSFNVKSGLEQTTIDVTTGKVRVSNQKKSSEVILTKGMSAMVNGNIVEAGETSNQNYLSWKTGAFSFSGATLTQVVHDLNTFLKKPVVLDKSLKDEFSITLNIKDANMQHISELLELVCEIDIEEQKNFYLIRGKE